MLDFLKNHPFAVEAFFEKSIVLTFAIPKVELRTFIPNCLTLDTLNDKFGFIAIALVQTKNLRPVGLPDFMGNDFFLVGYRVFVRYTNTAGKNLRGLYILKSETDKTLMEHLGNLFTHYNYTTTDIKQTQQANQLNICSKKSDFTVNLDLILGEIPLPKNSPFKDWKEARKYAGPLPFTFTYNADLQEVLIVEGVRQNWTPMPIRVINYHFGFLQNLEVSYPILANAFIINQVPYFWKKGKIETWNH